MKSQRGKEMGEESDREKGGRREMERKGIAE